MALVDTIARFKTGTYVVTRTPLGTYDSHGRLVAGSPSTFPIDALLVPPEPAQELEIRGEGFNVKDVRIAYTTTQLFPGSPTNAPDQISIDGDQHAVFRVVGPWIKGGNTFYEAWAARQRVP